MSTLKLKKSIAVLLGIFFSIASFAQQAQNAASTNEEHTILTNPVFIILLCIVILLLLVIIGMAEVVKAGAARQVMKSKKEKSNNTTKIASVIIFLLATFSLNAQAVEASQVSSSGFNYWNMGAGTFYLMLCVIFFELIFIYMLYRMGNLLLDSDVRKLKLQNERKGRKISESKLMISLMDAVPVEEEEAIMMDHNYDGIRELDNNLPPWWKYGFYLTVVIAVVYLFHFHVLHTGKLSIEEYNQEIKEGKEQVEEYRKTASDLVDETTVKRLTDPASIASGKAIFMENCTKCHGDFGEGMPGLGVNLTDDYWLYGGSVGAVFHTVTYGTNQGMKSWKQDLKPSEIQLVVSYVKSLRGTNPPNAKEKQGTFYVEEGDQPLVDSTKSGNDSLKKSMNVDSVKK